MLPLFYLNKSLGSVFLLSLYKMNKKFIQLDFLVEDVWAFSAWYREKMSYFFCSSSKIPDYVIVKKKPQNFEVAFVKNKCRK